MATAYALINKKSEVKRITLIV